MATPIAIVAVIWGGLGLLGLSWLSGAVVAWAHSGRWSPPPLAIDTISRVIEHGPAHVFGAPRGLLLGTWAALGVTVCALLGLWGAGGTLRRAADDPLNSLARPRDIATLTPEPARDRAKSLRPGIATTSTPEPGDIGLALGRLEPGGPILYASWEDVLLAIMAPRAGKTTSLAVPMVLSAPGAVIATSNKPDLVMATHALRAARGSCWVFDPQGIAHTPRRFTFNPLAGITNVGQAARLAEHFTQQVKDTSKASGDFWTSAGGDLLTAMILAAALSGRDLAQVYAWLNDSAARTPARLLREHGHHALAAGMEGRQSGAVETREGIYETARTAAQALRDPQIMAWVTPDPHLPAFDPAAFVDTGDTVYAMSKDGGASAAPLVASLVDALMRAGTARAEAAAGRLDPPMVAVLDEAANVARIADLPQLYSHLGSRGIIPVTILQSYRQGVGVWGEQGMDTLWGAATIKLVGAGIDDPKLAEDISKLVGEHDITVRSTTHSRDSSTQLSLRRQRILPPEAVRALPRGKALLLATGTKPAQIALQPWYRGPNAAAVSAATTAAQQRITVRAAHPGSR